MNLESIKTVKVIVKENTSRYAVSQPIYKEDYGLYFLIIEGLELPEVYTVDFSNSETTGNSVSMLGNSDGVLIPRQFIDTGKDIFAFLYITGDGFGRTVYKFKIPNRIRPDRTNEEPTPEQQSVIDQAISALNEAVAQTAEDRENTDASAQSASEYAEQAEISASTAQNYANTAEAHADRASASATASADSAEASAQSAQSAEQSAQDAQDALDEFTTPTASATTLPEGSNATASYADGHFTFGIPKGATGAQGERGEKGDKGDTGAQGIQGERGERGLQGIQGPKGDKGDTGEKGDTGAQGIKGDKGDKGDTGATGAKGEQGERGPQGIQGETGPQGPQGDDYVLTEQDKQDIADIAKADLTPTILNAFPTDIASGSIASFSDGADNLPLKSLVVNINPVQDLHGQESPYPAGGGKNKFNGTFLQGYWAYADGTWVNSPNWITTEKIPCKASTSYTVSADAKVTRWQGFVWYDSNGDFISTDNLNSNVNIGLTKTSPSNAAYLVFNIAGYPGTNDTIAPSDVTYFQLEEGSSSTAYAPYSNICPISGWTGMQLNANGTVIPISWQTEAGTVYGGTLDLVSGLLTINRTTVNTTWGSGINATNLGYVTRKRFNLDNPSKKYYTDAANDLKSNVIGQYNTLYSGDYVHMYLASTTHIWAYMPSNTAADTVMQFSYTLETPVTYQLTPTEVKTLFGVNNIFADTGDTEVEYRADTKLYIERLTAPDSADMIADANITSGQYFMVGNSLYKATANIANGGQIIVGTNCIRKSLSEALNEINA